MLNKECVMEIHRITGCVTALALLAGCAQEKKTEGPAASRPSQQASKPESPPEDTKNLTPTELMAKAKEALNKNDGPAGIKLLEQLVAKEPKNREAIFLLARVLQVRGMLAIKGGDKAAASIALVDSAKYMRQLRAAFPLLMNEEAGEMPGIFYNEARVLAQEKKTDAAMAALKDAFDAGAADLDLLSKDPDLSNLRSLPAFQEFLKTTTAKLAAQAKERARGEIAAQKPFEFDFSLPDVDGKIVSKKDFAGKVLIADIWGTWCPPCRQEIPHFVDLLKKYESRGLRIVGINYENGDAAQAKKVIQEFAKANAMNYPCLLGDDKTRSQVPNFQGFPTTVFLDRTGKVRLAAMGYHPMLELEAIILELLDEKTASVR
jgi:thiol-disulfide isomerase/thioredoxin